MTLNNCHASKIAECFFDCPLRLNSTRMLGLSLLGIEYVYILCYIYCIYFPGNCLSFAFKYPICFLHIKNYVNKLSIFLSMAATYCISTRYICLILRPNGFIVSNFMFNTWTHLKFIRYRFEGVNKCILIWILFFPAN